MTVYQIWIVLLLMAFIICSAVGGWLKHLGLIGFGLAALGAYILSVFVHAM